jgi:hypothetical protein
LRRHQISQQHPASNIYIYIYIYHTKQKTNRATMALRFILAKRLPITAASRMPAAIRYNSSSSSSRTARVIEMAAQAEKPSAMEATVPIMWAICGALTFAAWARIEEKSGVENVDKVCFSVASVKH